MAMTYENPEEGANRKITLCDGAFMVINDKNTWRPVETQLHIMNVINKLFHDKVNFEYQYASRYRMCTDKICDALKCSEDLTPIIAEWKKGAEEFKKTRGKYLLY